ncbi:MAG: hypothetical protein GY765_19540, partial [bacterium]|nr:hypothetical protein [bacterium]
MKIIKRSNLLKILAGFLLVCLLPVGAFPVLVGNHLEYAHKPKGMSALRTSASSLPYNQYVRDEVALAAVYLLKAKSLFDEALSQSEAYCMKVDAKRISSTIPDQCVSQEYNLENICESLGCAQEHVDAAYKIYDRLARDVAASKLPYNGVFVKLLIDFPYDEFFSIKIDDPTQLDKMACDLIKMKLSKGNVNEIYGIFAEHLDELRKRIKCIQDQIDCPSCPSASLFSTTIGSEAQTAVDSTNRIIHNFWNINYEFSWIHMFGQ